MKMLELSGLANHSIYPGSTALEIGDTGRTYGGKHINSSETLAFLNTHTQSMANLHTVTQQTHSATCVQHGYRTVYKKKSKRYYGNYTVSLCMA